MRTLSERPEIIVDEQGFSLGVQDPQAVTKVGVPGPLGRERIVTAIPTNETQTGPVLLDRGVALVDEHGFALADPDRNLLGESPLWVHRLLAARWTQDTRRL